MGFIAWVIGAGFAGYAIKKLTQQARQAAEERAEQERRKSKHCKFKDGISELEFERIVKHAGKRIRRLSDISFDGPIVYGTVESQSGISEWDFKLDFNDYGHITGNFWISSDNDDSEIPDRLGNLIKAEIKDYIANKDDEDDF